MPIITKAGSPVKGSPTQFTLDKTALAAIVADAYYADEDNWKEVQLNYKSSTGNQKEIVKFDASLASPTANFAVSLKAKDVFEIHNIVIKDFDGGAFEVLRSALTTAEFDVDMTAQAGSSVVWDFASRPQYSLNAQSEVVSSLSTLSNNITEVLFSLSEYTIPANGLELKMTANSGFLSLNQFEFFGVCNSSISSFGGFYRDYDTQYGVQNVLQSIYSYPATPEVEFKIIIKTTETIFYVNNVLLGTLGPVTVGPSIRLAIRFNNDINVKSCTIVEL